MSTNKLTGSTLTGSLFLIIVWQGVVSSIDELELLSIPKDLTIGVMP